jgi:hypothetical protein
LIVSFGIERVQPFGLGGTEQALVGGDLDKIVACTAQFFGRWSARI